MEDFLTSYLEIIQYKIGGESKYDCCERGEVVIIVTTTPFPYRTL